MANGGYFLIHRRFFNHWLWEERRRYSRAEAWLDLLQQASFADGQRFVSGSVVPLQRGQLFVSTRFLASRWQWNIKSVHQFLKLLEGERMIEQKVNAKGNTLTLVNFESYQTNGNAEVNAEETLRGTKQSNGNKRKIDKGVSDSVFEQVAGFLNETTGKNFRATGSALVRGVSARLKEGFTLQDFLKVIEFKQNQWGADAKMSGYLRPETLFGSKFESYLNEAGGTAGGSVSTWQDEQQRAALDDIFND
jgi:uncharacterized phage protein (TIGR02220 family)